MPRIVLLLRVGFAVRLYLHSETKLQQLAFSTSAEEPVILVYEALVMYRLKRWTYVKWSWIRLPIGSLSSGCCSTMGDSLWTGKASIAWCRPIINDHGQLNFTSIRDREIALGR